MKRLFGGATLLCAAFSADAGLIRADFGPAYALDGSDPPAYDSRWDSGEAWLGLDPLTDTPAPLAQDGFDFDAFHLALATMPGPVVTGITFLAESPAEDPTPIPEPETLALLCLGAGALGLARQGKHKRA